MERKAIPGLVSRTCPKDRPVWWDRSSVAAFAPSSPGLATPIASSPNYCLFFDDPETIKVHEDILTALAGVALGEESGTARHRPPTSPCRRTRGQRSCGWRPAAELVRLIAEPAHRRDRLRD